MISEKGKCEQIECIDCGYCIKKYLENEDKLIKHAQEEFDQNLIDLDIIWESHQHPDSFGSWP